MRQWTTETVSTSDLECGHTGSPARAPEAPSPPPLAHGTAASSMRWSLADSQPTAAGFRHIPHPTHTSLELAAAAEERTEECADAADPDSSRSLACNCSFWARRSSCSGVEMVQRRKPPMRQFTPSTPFETGRLGGNIDAAGMKTK